MLRQRRPSVAIQLSNKNQNRIVRENLLFGI
jgi:hypothetical protein